MTATNHGPELFHSLRVLAVGGLPLVVSDAAGGREAFGGDGKSLLVDRGS
ncbi:hypothetical protein [Streptomyces sp. ML-6]|nr:hypothetical protein [Streptomyces sp. ML-6]MDK0518242.1 hypothetical protein [Streptomyces sp. ML-6]